MSPPRRAPRLFLTAAAALLAGCARQPPQAEEEPPPAQVKWEAPRITHLEEWTELVGVAQPLPDHVSRVEARIDGRVSALLKGNDGKPLREGQEVQAGQEIGRLDNTQAKLNRDKAKDDLKAAEEDEEQAKTAETQAKALLEARQKLREKSPALVPDIDLKAAEAAVSDAASKVRAARSRREAADKAVKTLDFQLTLYTLIAPRKGRLGRVQVAVGQSLAVSAPVVDVLDIDEDIDVLCFASARVADRLRVGQPVRVGGIDDATDHDAAGEVTFIADQAEQDTGCFAVKVHFPNKRLQKRANAAMRVRVMTNTDNESWSIPQAALMEDQYPPGVLIVEDQETEKDKEGVPQVVGGKVRRLQAEIGLRATKFDGEKVKHRVTIVRLIDPDPESKKPVPELSDDLLFVTERGTGLQTGDKVRKVEEEPD
jgi:RND family efflux transporter MFP subunit